MYYKAFGRSAGTLVDIRVGAIGMGLIDSFLIRRQLLWISPQFKSEPQRVFWIVGRWRNERRPPHPKVIDTLRSLWGERRFDPSLLFRSTRSDGRRYRRAQTMGGGGERIGVGPSHDADGMKIRRDNREWEMTTIRVSLVFSFLPCLHARAISLRHLENGTRPRERIQ